MKVEFSKEFEKAFDRLSGKIYRSAVKAINEVIDATSIAEITDCKKIESLNSVYRIRIGSRRAFFVLHIMVDGDVVRFEYLISRGEAYSRRTMESLRNRDTSSPTD